MHCSNIRATGSYICGTNGHSNGLVPMLRCIKYDSRSCFQLSFLCSGFSTRPQDTSTKAAASVLVRPPATQFLVFSDSPQAPLQSTLSRGTLM